MTMNRTHRQLFQRNMTDTELRTEDSLQPVKYLGKILCFHPHGLEPTTASVRLIWRRSNKGRIYNRCALSIHPFGLGVYEEIAPGTYKSVWSHAIEDVSYCVAEPYHRRLFAWIARANSSDDLECHLVICKSSERARKTADIFARIFFQSFQMREEQRRSRISSPTPSIRRCSVCQTIARYSTNSLRRRYVVDDDNDDDDDIDDYERMSLHLPMMPSVFNETYETKSIRTANEESSNNPVEYYRG